MQTLPTTAIPGGREEYWLGQPLRGVQIVGARVLDIGAGDGRFACYLALQGAREVVALEPELAGSRGGAGHALRSRVEALGLVNVWCRPDAFQAFPDDPRGFDVIFAHHVVNHLDEDAVVVLHESREARVRFRQLFAKMFRLLRPGGTLILADCARDNLFARWGLRNPIAPTIEWNKHQNPELWIAMLREVGFERFALHWRVPRRLRALAWLLDHCATAYLLDSHFVLRCARPKGAGDFA